MEQASDKQLLGMSLKSLSSLSKGSLSPVRKMNLWEMHDQVKQARVAV